MTRLRPMVCQNGLNFERLRKKIYKTNNVVFASQNFSADDRGSRSNVYFQIIIIIINVRLWALKPVSMT